MSVRRPQAPSFKLDSESRMMQDEFRKKKYMDNEIIHAINNNLTRLADAIEEILRLVKKDMEKMEKIK